MPDEAVEPGRVGSGQRFDRHRRLLQHHPAGGQAAGGQVDEPGCSALEHPERLCGGHPPLLDFREGCRLEAGDVSAVLGVGRLPLPQVVRLLGGRLPAVKGDHVEAVGGGRLRVEGLGWSCLVTVAADPWRVVEVASESDGEPWLVRLGRHTASLPGWVRVEREGGHEWAELELVSLEWGTVEDLPDLPELPPCR